ncbi:ADP-dependent NAD(P)H-hydrate dehydratase [Microbacterium sp. DT81.1]|uniref:ADP-dependent NAD(P)H-hydrate dehydratase n=1 Tax=Microbacterium sp. DT81.1 TaxID=3393413 RepID=UPI003CF53231
MSSPTDVTPALLREWGLPDPGDSKKSRGRVMVVGGSRRSPGAVLLAGEAALRVGAGRLGLVVSASVEGQLGVQMPEAAVLPLPERATDPIEGGLREELASADAVLVGPGFDDADETRDTLLAIADAGLSCLVLDAYALGVLPGIDRGRLPATLMLNPNVEEAAILLEREPGEDRVADLVEIARRYDAVVNCYGLVVTAAGESWNVPGGGPGLGTSGSGDVLAGAIAGFAARGVDAARAAVWGSWAHARAGDRLTERTGIGFLAREIPPELTLAVREALG